MHAGFLMSELIQLRAEKPKLFSDGAAIDAEFVCCRLAVIFAQLLFQEAAVTITVQQFVYILDEVDFVQ